MQSNPAESSFAWAKDKIVDSTFYISFTNSFKRNQNGVSCEKPVLESKAQAEAQENIEGNHEESNKNETTSDDSGIAKGNGSDQTNENIEVSNLRNTEDKTNSKECVVTEL